MLRNLVLSLNEISCMSMEEHLLADPLVGRSRLVQLALPSCGVLGPGSSRWSTRSGEMLLPPSSVVPFLYRHHRRSYSLPIPLIQPVVDMLSPFPPIPKPPS